VLSRFALSVCWIRGGEAAAREFGLETEEKAELFFVLQLQAEQALEEIRAQAQATGVDQLSDEEINAETQAVRDKTSGTHRLYRKKAM
jgi:hypothetical protein